MPFPPYDRTPDLHTMLIDGRRRDAQAQEAVMKRATDAGTSGAPDQELHELAKTIEFLIGRDDCYGFTLEELDEGVTAHDIMGLVDQSLTDYIDRADSLEKVKGYAAVATEVYAFL